MPAAFAAAAVLAVMAVLSLLAKLWVERRAEQALLRGQGADGERA
jgi:ABC-type sulfate transport system permease subunit